MTCLNSGDLATSVPAYSFLRSKARRVAVLLLLMSGWAANGLGQQPTSQHPPSPVITGITFQMDTLIVKAPGSDNWTITWCDDGHQYTAWGDGGGFGGTNENGRVSMGFGRVEGTKNSYASANNGAGGFNVNGGLASENPHTLPKGKSLGVLCIDLSAHGGQPGTIYLARNGTGSTAGAFQKTEIHKSLDHGATWEFTGVVWSFSGTGGFYSPTILQFGKDYAGARDNYVYIYANENKSDDWDVQFPGEISLLRVPKDEVENQTSYEFFAGLDGNGDPTWVSDIDGRQPAFRDDVNGTMRTSVSYNAPLERYLLITQQVDRHKADDYHMGIYDAPEPWGPWTTVFFGNPNTDISPSLNTGNKTVFWNLSNKWLSADGKEFVLVYTGDGSDSWGTVEGVFTVAGSSDTTAPSVPQDLVAAPVSETRIDLDWTASTDTESGINHYRIYRDGAFAGQSTATSYADIGLTASTGYSYEVSAVNGAGLESSPSAASGATTLADTTAPGVASVSAVGDPNQVVVTFTEPVEAASATNIANYAVDNGVVISGASLAQDLVTVALQTSAHIEGVVYTLTVSNVKDRASDPNPIVPGTQVTYTLAAALTVSNLTVASGEPYEVVEGINTGDLCYIDRTFTYSNVPGPLVGSAYIKTANDDKSSQGDSFLTFSVNQDVKIYVAHDDRYELKPLWLDDFVNTGEDLETNQTHSLFVKDFPAGTVVLGGNVHPSEAEGNNMYTVIIVAESAQTVAPPTPTGLQVH